MFYDDGHHDITITPDGVTWHCSCGNHGKALDPKSTKAWSSEHVMFRDTKTFWIEEKK